MTRKPSSSRYHEPLHPEDSETQTFGCRHASPHTCAKHSLRGVCAFVREDRLCLSPRRSWPQQYRRLILLPDTRGDDDEGMKPSVRTLSGALPEEENARHDESEQHAGCRVPAEG
jgi:hypothetical protein